MFPIKDSEPSQGRAIVTLSLIALNLCIFFYEISLDEFSLNHLLITWGTVPARLDVADLFTSMFLHGGWMHVLGNMWFLYIFGDNVEDILGHGKFLIFYLACGLAGGLLHIAFNTDSRLPAIGASGAISGVMGAYIVNFPHARIKTLLFFIFFITTIEVPAFLMIGFWFLSQVLSGVGTMGATAGHEGGTAFFAHVGGFVAGAILIKVIPSQPRWAVRKEFRW